MSVVNVSAVSRRKIWSANAVEGEHLFGSAFVLGQKMRVWPSPRVRNSQKVHVRGNVHLLGIVAGIGFGEIEDEVSAAFSRSEEHTSELQSLRHLVCRLLLEKKNRDR